MRKANLIQTAIWRDGDFLALPTHARFAYLLLLTQPDVNATGHLGIARNRWARMLDITPKQISVALDALEQAGFIWVDHEIEQLAIRSWVKHNINGSKLEAAARDQFAGIASDVIRAALAAEYPTLFTQGGAGAPPRQSRKAVPSATRFRILKRDAYTCRYCGRRPPEVALEVDHVDSAVNGGGDDDANLVAACVECNLGKGADSVPHSEIPDTPSEEREYPIPENRRGTRGEGRGKRDLVVSGGSESERARVWAAYQEHHPRSALTSDRRSLIDRRLADYPADRLIAAIHGNHLDPHCNGDNPRGQEYHDLELILRDAGHIERYAAVAADGPPQPRSQSPAGKTLALARQLAEEGR